METLDWFLEMWGGIGGSERRVFRFIRDHPGWQRYADISKGTGLKNSTVRQALCRVSKHPNVERVKDYEMTHTPYMYRFVQSEA